MLVYIHGEATICALLLAHSTFQFVHIGNGNGVITIGLSHGNLQQCLQQLHYHQMGSNCDGNSNGTKINMSVPSSEGIFCTCSTYPKYYLFRWFFPSTVILNYSIYFLLTSEDPENLLISTARRSDIHNEEIDHLESYKVLSHTLILWDIISLNFS